MPRKTKDEVSSVSENLTVKVLNAEAEALGPDFQLVKFATADLVAEAEEMILRRADAEDLARREFPVTVQMFDRAKVLARMLAPSAAERVMVRDHRKGANFSASSSRDRLLWIRERFVALCGAVGFETDLLTNAPPRGVDELSEHMLAVIDVITHNRACLPDKSKLDALVEEAVKLINDEKTARREGNTLEGKRLARTRRVEQLKRLLYDQLRHLSNQGLAAYPDDLEREIAYRLDRFVNKRKKSESVEEPVIDDPAPT